jgi:hypothetical protein
MPSRPTARGIPVEDFLQAIGEQLDRAQDALAIKARTGRPLTWALRDLKLALQVFVEVDAQGQVLWRAAGPNETGASTVNLEFTTITRPMIEENTYSVLDEADARSIDQIGGDLSDDERARLRRLGVRNVGQLRRLAPNDAPRLEAIGEMVNIPVGKLEAALRASSRPSVAGHDVVRRNDETLVRIHGANLTDGIDTEVLRAGAPVEVVDARPQQLLVRPLEHHDSGSIEVFTGGERATGFFRLPDPSKRIGRPSARGNGAHGSGTHGNGAHGNSPHGNGNGAKP